jgi:hypothetical protein
MACGALAIGAGSASAAAPGSMYFADNGLCVSNLGATSGNAPVAMETCNGSWRQTWVAEEMAFGGMQFQNAYGGCIAHPNNSANAGLTIQACSGINFAQQFFPNYAVIKGNQGFGLTADNSSYGVSNFCASSDGKTNVGAQVLLEACARSDSNQTILGEVTVYPDGSDYYGPNPLGG